MFTGIVEEVGTLIQLEPTGLIIQSPRVLEDIEVKDSIAVDGTCLTITEREKDCFRVDIMPETLRCTRLGSLQPGALVNLERPLAANGRLGGHMVQGHVEAAVPVLSIKEDGIALQVESALPEQLRPYVISKGFVAVNGVSLTVVESRQDRFSVALVPYTQEHTNLGSVQVGTLLNVETDILGRYVVQFLRLKE
ncbi:MAG TPA: riboflavin synthase [Ktedonobacteraceae bacterium]|nr:riboflavin synthase [Ktedonobacteraceae bacterium]